MGDGGFNFGDNILVRDLVGSWGEFGALFRRERSAEESGLFDRLTTQFFLSAKLQNNLVLSTELTM